MQAIELLQRNAEEERPLTYTEKQTAIIRTGVDNPSLDETVIADRAGASETYTRRVLLGAHPDDAEDAEDSDLTAEELAKFRSVFKGRVDAEDVSGEESEEATASEEDQVFHYGEGEHDITIRASGELTVNLPASADVDAQTAQSEPESEPEPTPGDVAEIDVGPDTRDLINEAQRLAEEYGVDFEETLSFLVEQ